MKSPRFYLALVAGAMSGCVVMTPTPITAAAQVISSGITSAASLTPPSSSAAVSHDYVVPAFVCIEWNPQVPVEDLIPVLQNELKRWKVDSRVYDSGMAPASCAMVLNYVAKVEWGKPLLGDEYAMYIAALSLSLRRNGSVLASSSYQIDPFGYERWRSTSAKVAPLVDKLFAH